MNNSACSADWQLAACRRPRRPCTDSSVNWKDCVHRWKRSRDKWRFEAVGLQKQLYELTGSAQHWSRQASAAQSQLAQARGALNGWRADTYRGRESAGQWKAQAIGWREEARRWKLNCG
ncbi:hypothetical protein BOX15_Mlig005078g1 [Macrostomum lignano]|nr:hypothetical protein BOX15_Mlig005078g3 [Macrostomum lignano]PAA58365.1 hypothetical protein BOX15_Mlig005078g1 [Macrostomum lignano]